LTPEEARTWLDQHEIKIVRTEGVGPDGLVMGKHLSRSKFERSLPLGPALADFALAYDVAGSPQFGWWDDWRQDFLGDMHQRPDLDTLVAVPNRPGEAVCFADHVDTDGEPLPVDPRSLLKRVVERLASTGLGARGAFELEFMVFAESYDEARAKGYRELTPLGVPKTLAYLAHDAHRMTPFMDEVVRRLDGFGVPWEAWSGEAAPAQVELNFEPSDPVAAADHVIRTRNVLREVAVDQGHSVTFMAKPSEVYGNGMHIHHSLQQADGSPAFYDASSADGRSRFMRNWIGGLIQTMPAAHSFMTPTINSYRRLIGFAAAPVVVGWAEDNKSTALRLISRSEKLARVEHRVGASDLNPYLALAAIFAGGMIGVEQGVEPPPEMRLLAWGLPDRFPYLPATITAAADALEQDKALTDILGPSMVLHWVNTRRWEWMMYHTTGGDAEATTVTDWELDRYFEVI
jgi:glutamine synthetase